MTDDKKPPKPPRKNGFKPIVIDGGEPPDLTELSVSGFTPILDLKRLRAERPDIIKSFALPGTGVFCSHKSVEVSDEDLRQVFCATCGAELDPFNVLRDFAVRERNMRCTDASTKADARNATAQLKEMKRQLDNARAQLRREVQKEGCVLAMDTPARKSAALAIAMVWLNASDERLKSIAWVVRQGLNDVGLAPRADRPKLVPEAEPGETEGS